MYRAGLESEIAEKLAREGLLRKPVFLRRRQKPCPDDYDWLVDPAGKGRLSHKLEYGYEQRSRWSRMLSEIMASQHLTPSPPSPLPLGEGRRGEGKELMRQPQGSCLHSWNISW